MEVLIMKTTRVQRYMLQQEKSQTEKAMYYMSQFMWNIQERQMYKQKLD